MIIVKEWNNESSAASRRSIRHVCDGGHRRLCMLRRRKSLRVLCVGGWCKTPPCAKGIADFGNDHSSKHFEVLRHTFRGYVPPMRTDRAVRGI